MVHVDAVISGAGQSEVGRRVEQHPHALLAASALAAIESAGLEPADIDGVSTYPGGGDLEAVPGLSGAGALDAIRILGLKPQWFSGGVEMPSQLGAIFNAAAAVASGLARHVLCFRSVAEVSARTRFEAGEPPTLAMGDQQWLLPYGQGLLALGGLDTQRYLHMSGSGREQMANVALFSRRHAAANPDAVYRAPLDRDAYLAAPMVSDPLCLLDCDAPVDGCTAFVISAPGSTSDAARVPISIESVGAGVSMEHCAQQMWETTAATTTDVDLAAIYDGFSVFVPQWIEAMGFCDQYRGLEFIGDGDRVSISGELPLNTGGGQLSGGRLHGFGHLYEACQQLWQQCGERQVSNPELALVTAGAHKFIGSMLVRM